MGRGLLAGRAAFWLADGATRRVHLPGAERVFERHGCLRAGRPDRTPRLARAWLFDWGGDEYPAGLAAFSGPHLAQPVDARRATPPASAGAAFFHDHAVGQCPAPGA